SSLAGDLDELEVRWTNCRTNRQRLHVIRDAQAIGSRLARIDPEAGRRAREEWERKIADDPRSSRIIAAAYGINYKQVQRIKERHGTTAPNGTPAFVKQQALNMLASGHSTTVVAVKFDVNPATVRRWRASGTA